MTILKALAVILHMAISAQCMESSQKMRGNTHPLIMSTEIRIKTHLEQREYHEALGAFNMRLAASYCTHEMMRTSFALFMEALDNSDMSVRMIIFDGIKDYVPSPVHGRLLRDAAVRVLRNSKPKDQHLLSTLANGCHEMFELIPTWSWKDLESGLLMEILCKQLAPLIANHNFSGYARSFIRHIDAILTAIGTLSEQEAEQIIIAFNPYIQWSAYSAYHYELYLMLDEHIDIADMLADIIISIHPKSNTGKKLYVKLLSSLAKKAKLRSMDYERALKKYAELEESRFTGKRWSLDEILNHCLVTLDAFSMVDEEAGESILACLKWFAVKLTKESIYGDLKEMDENFRKEHPELIKETLPRRLDRLVIHIEAENVTFEDAIDSLKITLADYKRSIEYRLTDAHSPLDHLFRQMESLSNFHQPLKTPQMKSIFLILNQQLLFDNDEGRQVARLLCSEEHLITANSFKMCALLAHNLSIPSFVSIIGYLVDMFVATFESKYILTIEGALYYNSMINSQLEPIIVYLFNKTIDRVDEKETKDSLTQIMKQILPVLSADRYHWVMRKLLVGKTDYNTSQFLYKLDMFNLLLSLRPIVCEKTAGRLLSLSESLQDSHNQDLTRRLERAEERLAEWGVKLGLPGLQTD